ncbi:transcription initiation factor TFIID subunit 4 isoform X2 [Belonocnema kinseyi]|uniref:transcription initiation factor TFIID subunit 4 isoform X2 n=1 Tax=Belonocnema kinseyi TaxID=2817044 RepID=UPI00143D1698|nr:transcription initiation factor TFIID subunit 4 isoform X2 [Belonocnema kinseyi]
MASAKFLEEVLNSEIDEKAVNLLVDRLTVESTHHNSTESPQQNHHNSNSTISNGGTVVQLQSGVANGGAQTSVNSVPGATVQQNQQNQQNPQNQQNQSTATYQSLPAKIIYSAAGQVLTTSGVVNANNKITFPGQTVGQLVNGTLGVTNVTNVVTSTGPVKQAGGQVNLNKQTGTALVIKSSAAPGGMVSVPVSVGANTGNMQILNMNAIRPGTPIAGQQVGKQVAPRIVIGQQMVGARPGAPITLQAFHGLQIQGNLIVKTENGQYQCIRVAAPASSQQQQQPGGNAVTANSIAGNTVVGTPSAGTTYRLASVPVTAQSSVATATATATATQSTPSSVASSTPNANATSAQTGQTPAQRQTTDNTKEKCRKFLANLLELSSREPRQVERNVRTLIQELIDTKVEPEEFCDRLERLLNASPQPCLIGFLKKSLPLLRQSLVTQELVIEGIRPPPANVVFCIASATPVATQNQVRNTVAVLPMSVAAVASAAGPISSATPSATTQVRVMAPHSAVTTTVPRALQQVQQRLIRPVTTVARSQASAVRTTLAVNALRNAAPIVQRTPTSTILKTINTSAQGKSVNTNTTLNKIVVPSILPKATVKEKEKKTFSSAGYTGDDDINDVAAMGGVNLAEESQRILGSTEFVGTQIRSCKDEAFLLLSPLQQRIKQIVSKYALEEPNQEVSTLISHAVQERLKNLVEKLAIIGEHRIDLNKMDPRYEVSQDVRTQLKFLEDLDRVERRRHEEHEREMLLRAAKSRAKTEDPEQAKLKAKAKEMQRAEMEELRQREANLTALQAIGPRKKPKLDSGGATSSTGASSGLSATASGLNRQMPLRPRVKRVNMRDMLFLLEQEKETCRSATLYKSYLK